MIATLKTVILKKVLPIALFCAVWEAACFFLKIPAYIVPAPHRVVEKLFDSWPLLYSHSLVSIAGILPKIIIAMLIAFFPVLVNAVVGLRSVDGEIVELMDSIAANRRQMFWRVRLPNSLPYILPALKVAALLSVVGAMVGEFVGSDRGLGYLMILGDVNLDTDLLFASLAVVTAFGMIIY